MDSAFGDCVVDGSCFELRRRGKSVKLEPKVFDVLVYLIEHRDRVVTKRELLDALWAGEAVSDSVLPRCIAAIRRAVGDTRTRQRTIATVHGRGYRFIAPLDEEGSISDDGTTPSEASGAGDQRGPVVTASTAGSDGSVGVSSRPSDFVGRVDALERLRRMLGRSVEGEGSIALIVGEPGIGKTRLAEELSIVARDGGTEVLVGRCYEGEGAPPYWPWVQILRQAVAGVRDEGTLRAELGTGAGDLAELVPELREQLGALPAVEGPGGEQARFRLYDAVARFFQARAQSAPLLLILDDLHWADASSLGLLRFLARQVATGRMLVVGTYRDVDVRRGHPLADLLGALARENACERIALVGLDETEIGVYVRLLSGEMPRTELVSTLADMTEGNPFFLHEIVRLLAEEGVAASADSGVVQALELPQGVKDAIGRRLDTLSSDCNDMLRAAAVLGRVFRSGVVEAMLGAPAAAGGRDEAILELLGEALEAGVIVEAAHGSYAFAHALTRQTLYEELRAPQRIVLHRRAGEVLGQGVDPGRADDETLAELAHHFFEAAPGGDVDRAIEFALAAAAASRRKFAYDEAVAFLERALEAFTLRVPVDEAKRAELTLALGEARFTAGHRREAIETLVEAADLARSLGRVDLMADAGIAIRGFGELGTPPTEEVVRLLHDALEALPEDDLARRARVLSRLNNGSAARTMEERDRISREALELAERSGDAIALRDALFARWWATLGPDRIDERYEVARALHGLAEQTDDRRTQLLALEIEIGADLLRGDFESTERNFVEFERVASELRQPVFIFMGMNYRTSWLINRGRYAEAEQRVAEAYEYGRDVVPFADVMCKGQLYWSRGSRGVDTDPVLSAREFGELLSQSLGQKPIAVEVFSTMLHYSIDRDAIGARERLADLDYRSIERDEHWLLVMSILGEIARGAGDREMMEWLHDQLLPFAELIAIHDLMRAGRGSVKSVLGVLAAGLGDLETAIERLEEAVDKERAADMRPSMFVSQLELARSLRARGEEGDAERAEGLIAEVGREVRAEGIGPGTQVHGLLSILEET